MRDASKTRGTILDSALKLFSRNGYHDTRITDIVEHSDTSKGTVYHHFRSKEEIFEALLQRAIENFHRKILKACQRSGLSVRERLYTAAKIQAQFFLENAEIAHMVFMQGGSPQPEFKKQLWEWREKFHTIYRELFEEGMGCARLKNLDASLLAHAFLGIMHSFAPAYIKGDHSADELADFALELFLKGAENHEA